MASTALEPLLGLESTPPAQPGRAVLLWNSDGSFYGTSKAGGDWNKGTIFRLNISGQMNWQSFSGYDDGSKPEAPLPGDTPLSDLVAGIDGWLWGTTSSGGQIDANGTVFKTQPGTWDTQIVVAFSGSTGPLPGKTPVGGLTRLGDRWLWGTTRDGGTAGFGSLYRVDALTGACREMLTFTGTTGVAPGAAPEGRLYADASGNLWGTTTAGGAGDNGVIFKYQTATGIYTVIAALVGNHTGVKGRKPAMGLTPDGAGKLWGVAEQSGAGSAGTLFRVNMAAGTAETVFEFSGNATATATGAVPVGPLVHDGAGFLWGAASAGGVGARGTIFKVNQTSGAVTLVFQFGSLSGANISLSTPVSGLTKDGAGYLWGLAQRSGAGARAVIYKVKMTDGSFIRVADYGTPETPLRGQTPGPLTQAENGAWLWGTTETGGQYGHGTLYRYQPLTKVMEVKTHFTGTSGAAPGSLPRGKLFVSDDGVVWGTTQYGGASNFGTLFKYVPDAAKGGVFTSLVAFDTTTGVWPHGSLTEGSVGYIWGTTEGTVNSEYGTIFKINRSSGQLTMVHRFTDRNQGATPSGGLVWGSDDWLMGMTNSGGSTAGGQLMNYGTIYQINTSTGAHTMLLAFTGADGNAPGYGKSGELLPAYFAQETQLWGCTQSYLFRFKLQSRELQNVLPRFIPPGDTFPKQVGTAVFSNGFYPVCLGLEQTQDPLTLETSLRRVIYAVGSSSTRSAPFSKQLTLAEDATLATLPDQPLEYSQLDEHFYGAQRTGQMESPGSGTAGGILFAVHQKEFLPGLSPCHPALATRPVQGGTVVNGTAVMLRGVVNANVPQPTPAAIVLGTSTRSMTSTGPITNVTGGEIGTLISSSRALAPHTTYFYRSAVIPFGEEPAYGGLRYLMTGAAVPVSGPEISVESPPGTLASETIPIDFGSARIGTTKTQAVTLRNLGDAALTGLSARIEAADLGRFTLTMAADRTSLSGADSMTGLLISFTPQLEGSLLAQLIITSNDPDEQEIYIPLIGNGNGTPTLVVENSAGVSLASGATYDLGNVEINDPEPTTRTLMLRNTGNGTLIAEHLVIEDDEYGLFSNNWQGALSLSPGETTNVELSFSTPETGTKTARFVIAETAESPQLFSLNLRATGVAIPRLSVTYMMDEYSSEVVEKGVTRVNFGKVTPGRAGIRQFILSNLDGSGSLTGLSMDFPVGAPFSLVSPLPATIPLGGEATVEVQFQPTAPGDYEVPVTIRSNDPDDDPFPFFLTGISPGPSAPRIATQPLSQWAQIGREVRFTPEVKGSRPMLWEWRVGGKVVPTEKGAEYRIHTAAASHATSYQFTVRNQIGTPAVSQMVWLGVVTLAPERVGVKPGGILNLRCVAAVPKATGVSVKYRWRRGDEPLSNGALPSGAVVSGADKADLKITKMTNDDGLYYDCEVTLITPGGELKTLHGETLVDVLTEVPLLDAPVLADAIPFGSAVNVQLRASHTPSSYSAMGLPIGLRLDTVTGRLTGRPTVVSRVDAKTGAQVPFKILFRATNAVGTGPALEVLLTITDHFAQMAGSYLAPVPRHDATNFQMGGMMQLAVTRTGVASGTLILAGQRHPFTTPLMAVTSVIGDSASASGVLVERKPAYLDPLSLNLGVAANYADVVIKDRQWRGLGEGRYYSSTIYSKQEYEEEDALMEVTLQTPSGVAFDREGVLYFADSGNHVIHHKVAWEDSLSFLLGMRIGELGVSGATDGYAPLFNRPEALAIDPRGFIQIADTGNATIRTRAQSGIVNTLAGTAGQMGHVDGKGPAARFREPCGICADPAGNLYVTDRLSHVIRKITPAGVVTTLAGKPGISGHRDGTGSTALFHSPNAITYDPVQAVLFVADTENHVIRRVTLTGAVTTWIGSPKVPGNAPGLRGLARLTRPRGITTDGRGNLFFTAISFWQANRAGLAMPIMPEFTPALDTPDLLLSSLAFDPITNDLALTQNIAGYVQRFHVIEAEESVNAISFAFGPAIVSPSASILADFSGQSTLALISGGEPGTPAGSGFATLAISRTGTVTATGKMADGAAFTSGGSLAGSEYLGLSMHAMLSKNSASLELFLAMFEETSIQAISRWRKLPQPLTGGDSVHTAGFDTTLNSIAGRYQPPGNVHAFFGLTDSPAAMTFNAAGTTFEGINQTFNLLAPNTAKFPPSGDLNPADVRISFTPATGLFTGSFKSGIPTRTTNFSGILVNSLSAGMMGGFGYFHYPESTEPSAPTISGAVTLDPF